MMKRNVFITTVAGVVLLAGVRGVVAESAGDGNEAADEAREIETATSAPVSLAQAIATAETQSSGLAVSAEAEAEGNHVLYEIKTINDGKMAEFHIEPQTGNVVKTGNVKDTGGEYADAVQLKSNLSSAIAFAEHVTGGKTFEAGLSKDDGRTLYMVEVEAGGAIRKVKIDSDSGKVIEITSVEDD